MVMSHGTPDLAGALMDVRKAYRLLWLYQQTLMDTYTEILRHLNVTHYYGNLKPLQRGTNPVPQSPGAFLPLLQVSTLYLSMTDSPHVQQPGDYMIELRHIGDTGNSINGYPTAAPSVSQSSTELWIYVFHATAASEVNWHGSIWQNKDYPEHDTKLVLNAQPNIQVYGSRFDVATLGGPQAIAAQMAHFKSRVQEVLGLQL